LTILTNPPGSNVLIDNQSKGSTDANGALTIRGLKAGTYTVTIRKPNFEDENRAVEVVAGKKQTAEFVLSPAPGRLRVVSTVADAKIEVNGLAYPNGTDMPLTPGVYRISIAKLGYRTATREIAIVSGKSESLTITPEKLPFEEMKAQAIKSLNERNFDMALSLGREMLSTHPETPEVNLIVAYGYYFKGNYNDSIPYFTKELSLNGETLFKVRHRHNRYETMCLGNITLTKTTFAFKSDTHFDHDFKVTYDRFKEMLVEPGAEGVLHLKVRIPKSGGRKGEDEKDQNFYVQEAETPAATYGCSNCRVRMDVIRLLMHWARNQALGGR
jgi:hypothetical protein